MQISITGRHFTVTEPIKEYIEEKFLRLDKYKDKIIEAHVILSVEKYRHHAEISLAAKGSNIIVNAESENMYASIDKVLGKIQTKIRRRSERLKER
ncbi:MAG: ribosome-associated translation inhibitor RaiA, partial [Candidatus Omnitrophica bacterium]|nr:ribosome-associated translation inhibitor RaiA [Candidatus Omnitrophota bacterium]